MARGTTPAPLTEEGYAERARVRKETNTLKNDQLKAHTFRVIAETDAIKAKTRLFDAMTAFIAKVGEALLRKLA